MKTGTHYFPSYGAALRYYRPHSEGSPIPSGANRHARKRMDMVRALVDQKLNAGEIHIGKPAIMAGESLTIEDNRYHINAFQP